MLLTLAQHRRFVRSEEQERKTSMPKRKEENDNDVF